MQYRTCGLVAVFAFSMMAGCLGGPTSGPDDGPEETGAGGLRLYRPINRSGEMDLVPPTTVPPRDTSSPACQVIEARDSYRVLDLAAAITWEATSERTRTLRLALVTGSSGGDVFVEGTSPLNLTVPAFNVTADEKFGLVVSILGEEPLDPLLEPQLFEFEAHFVAQLGPDQEDADLGLWLSECPA